MPSFRSMMMSISYSFRERIFHPMARLTIPNHCLLKQVHLPPHLLLGLHLPALIWNLAQAPLRFSQVAQCFLVAHLRAHKSHHLHRHPYCWLLVIDVLRLELF